MTDVSRDGTKRRVWHEAQLLSDPERTAANRCPLILMLIWLKGGFVFKQRSSSPCQTETDASPCWSRQTRHFSTFCLFRMKPDSFSLQQIWPAAPRFRLSYSQGVIGPGATYGGRMEVLSNEKKLQCVCQSPIKLMWQDFPSVAAGLLETSCRRRRSWTCWNDCGERARAADSVSPFKDNQRFMWDPQNMTRTDSCMDIITLQSELRRLQLFVHLVWCEQRVTAADAGKLSGVISTRRESFSPTWQKNVSFFFPLFINSAVQLKFLYI